MLQERISVPNRLCEKVSNMAANYRGIVRLTSEICQVFVVTAAVGSQQRKNQDTKQATSAKTQTLTKILLNSNHATNYYCPSNHGREPCVRDSAGCKH